VNIAAPQGQHPVVDLYGGGHGDDQGGNRKEKTEPGVHAADVHVVGPDNKAEHPDGQDCPHHHAVTEDILAGMGADQVGDNAKGRQRNDIDLRVAKKPEQVLEQDRAAALVVG